MVDHESDHICSLQLLTVSTQRYPNISFYYLYNIGKIYYLATNGLKAEINQLIFIGIFIMNKIMSSISAILFIFILFVTHQSLAHDGEQHLENEHDSPNSHSESHEEGSGMR